MKKCLVSKDFTFNELKMTRPKKSTHEVELFGNDSVSSDA